MQANSSCRAFDFANKNNGAKLSYAFQTKLREATESAVEYKSANNCQTYKCAKSNYFSNRLNGVNSAKNMKEFPGICRIEKRFTNKQSTRPQNRTNTMARQYFFVLVTALTISAMTLKASGQTQYTITDLGAYAQANAINNSGQVVGVAPTTARINGQLHNHAVIWDRTGKMTDLGVLPFGSTSVATAINDAGQVAGYSDVSFEVGQYFGPNNHAFLWDPTYGLQESRVQNYSYFGQNFQSQFSDTTAFGVNSHIVIGGAQNSVYFTAGPFIEYFTSPNNYGLGENTTIGTVAYGGGNTAYGINRKDHVVGVTLQQVVYMSQYTAFLYNGNNGSITNLGTLSYDISSGTSFTTSTALALNDSDQVVGRCDGVAMLGNGVRHAFLWQNGQMQYLGALSASYNYSVARAINSGCQVVGDSEAASGDDSAFIWNSLHGMQDLNQLTPTGTGWQLQQANGINDSGQIVGYGTLNGAHHAFLLTPITPAQNATSQLIVQRSGLVHIPGGSTFTQQVTLTNNGARITTPVVLVLNYLSSNATLLYGDGVTQYTTPLGSPYLILNQTGVAAGQSITVTLTFNDPQRSAINYTPCVLIGSVTP